MIAERAADTADRTGESQQVTDPGKPRRAGAT